MNRDEVDGRTWCPDITTPSKRHLPDTENGVPRELSYIDWRQPTTISTAIIAECRQLADVPREDVGAVPLFEPCPACIATRGNAFIPHRQLPVTRPSLQRVTNDRARVVIQDSRTRPAFVGTLESS
ncbi:MAG: hypothetical protein ACRDQ5_24400 [Sciscionella sp.]